MAAFILITFILTMISVLSWTDDQAIVDLNVLLIIAYTISYLSMVILTAKVTASDPTDPTIALHRLA